VVMRCIAGFPVLITTVQTRPVLFDESNLT
jgi:hypothetical protein